MTLFAIRFRVCESEKVAQSNQSATNFVLTEYASLCFQITCSVSSLDMGVVAEYSIVLEYALSGILDVGVPNI